MKTNYILSTLIMLFCVFTATAQQGINYKAIIHDADGDVLANTLVALRFTILENGTTDVYQELHRLPTDDNGIVIVNIGEGQILNGDYSIIDWGSNPHFLKTEFNTGSVIETDTSEIKYVPYSYYAKQAGNVFSGNYNDLMNLPDFDALIERVEYLESRLGLEEPFVDIDNNSYETVKIGDQVWMAENLKVTRYADGTSIPLVSDDADWAGLSVNDKAYCYYDNDESLIDDYGLLYNWAAVMNDSPSSASNPSGVQGVCPDGWHVPSYVEWEELVDYLGGLLYAGGHLKEFGTKRWDTPNVGASNTTRFAAPGGGMRLTDGFYGGLKGMCNYSHTTEEIGRIQGLRLWNSTGEVDSDRLTFFEKQEGISVRCVKDLE